MTIKLFVEPRKVYSWVDFKKEKPPYSIALDGLVKSPTKRDPAGPYANYDHHSCVDRLATRCTSEQVHLDINMGLFETFCSNNASTANVYINDPDEDTCLAWWLLKNNERVRFGTNSLINNLVYFEDRLDSTAGAYPFGDSQMRRQMAWIFEPYNKARFEGKVPQMDSLQMKEIIEKVEKRIDSFVVGESSEIPLEGNYEKIGGGDKWALINETGPASRMAIYDDNVKAFVTLVTKKPDNTYVYTIGRKSVWIPFNIPKLYHALNEEEGDIITRNNKWGGSNTIGGSPRERGSTIEPKRLEEIINSHIQ